MAEEIATWGPPQSAATADECSLTYGQCDDHALVVFCLVLVLYVQRLRLLQVRSCFKARGREAQAEERCTGACDTWQWTAVLGRAADLSSRRFAPASKREDERERARLLCWLAAPHCV